MNKKLLPFALLFVSVSGMAGQASVTKVDTPNRIVLPGGTGLSVYTIGSRDMQGQTIAKIDSIEWSTTGYPRSIGEAVELCFRTYGAGTRCVPIAPNSYGVSYDFNDESFYPGAGVNIRHTTTAGSARNSQPSGQDTVRFNISY
ncbi:hypothetical protein [Pseudomonas abietaniphila]|uniref:Spore coat protein U (SCPU) domain-containing protein n=1 Tax=Pseudomonas abietaniphila TaxID=89065 RepID=A0A1G8CC01_9PSED|nr:hypothetical protein [Pseudomonas abietaniphila]SDH42390.1 hypothetical protein SAMN05216605_106191 [Pseudomonas abietaniphila]